MTAARKGGGYVAVAQEIESEAQNENDGAIERAKIQRCPDLVEAILSRAKDPWIALRLADVEIVSVRAGGIVVAMGPTGAGKTSLIAGFLVEHARWHGPVVVLSRELPADEFAARVIGMQCDASWPDVLMGKVMRSEMERVLALPRMLILDRRSANLSGLTSALTLAKAEHPDEPILVAIDYVQILESAEKDARAKVADVIAQIDDLTRAYGAVTIAISQMSRAASRAARNGEAMGIDSTDGGAESAAIERAATVTLSIGASGPEREDGTRAVDLSIGKGRMTGGDRVFPASYCGRSGKWRITGEARPAADVKAEKKTARDDTAARVLALAIPGVLDASPAPMSGRDLRSELGAKDAHVRLALKTLLEDPASSVVQVGPRKGGAWQWWGRTKAEAARAHIVPREIGGCDA